MASELHGDFSQRLAILALKLENVSEAASPMSKETEQQFHEILNFVGELEEFVIEQLSSTAEFR